MYRVELCTELIYAFNAKLTIKKKYNHSHCQGLVQEDLERKKKKKEEQTNEQNGQ